MSRLHDLRRIAVSVVCLLLVGGQVLIAQIDADRVMHIGLNALYYRDYVVAISYFNQVIGARPWWAKPYFYRAVAKLSLEDYSGALADADSALKQNMFIPGAYLARGIAHQHRKNYQAAEADYRSGLKLTPNNEGLGLNLTNLLLYSKQYAAADSAAKDLLSYHPQSQVGKLMMAEARWELQDSLAALQIIDTVIKEDSLFAQAYQLRAQIHHRRGYLDSALVDLDRAIALEPKDLGRYINRGIMRYQNNDIRGAMADYNHVIEQQSNHRLARYNRALLQTYVGSYSKALKDFDVVIRLEPDNYFAIYNRGLILSRNGLFARAIADFDLVLKAYPEFMVCYLARSEAKRKQGQMKEAEKDYLLALRLEQKQQKELHKNPKATQQANKDLDTGGKDDSRDETDKNIEKFNLLVMSSEHSEAPTGFSGKLRGQIQNQDVAIEPRPLFTLSYECRLDAERTPLTYTDENVEQLNRSEILPLKLGICNYPFGVTTVQLNLLQQEIEEASRDKEPFARAIRKGLAYLQLQNHDQSTDEFATAIKERPSSPIAYLGRAMALSKSALADRVNLRRDLLERGTTPNRSEWFWQDGPKLQISSTTQKKIEQAIADLDEAISLSPHSAVTYFNRAWLLFEQGNRSSAIVDYSRAIDMYPKFADAYYNRGLLFLSAGQAKEGIADLSKAGELGLYEAYNIIKRFNK